MPGAFDVVRDGTHPYDSGPMNKTLRSAFAIMFGAATSVAAQQSGARVSVRVMAEGQPLAHAQARSGTSGAETNAAGLARLTLPPGQQTLKVTLLGYRPDSVTFVVVRDTLVEFTLEAVAAELSGVVVMSARGAQRIEAEPLRVEVMGGDDVAEKTEMRPSDLTKFLAEMAGVRVQQLSAASGAAAVRLQGLKPRYSLLLADGLPLYGGSGSGLDLLQLPPADLHQIEVVKGPASALYGASALGGMINLISKRPGHESDYLLQGTSELGFNSFGWQSNRVNDRFGYTVVSGLHSQKVKDMDGDNWGDIPGVRRAEVRPRLFFDWPAGHTLFVTVGATAEKRDGGMLPGTLAPDGLPYSESVKTTRADVGVVAHRLVGRTGLVQWRTAANVDRKNKTFGSVAEDVTRSTMFTEVSYANSAGNHDWLAGTAAQVDAAKLPQFTGDEYTFSTVSAFAQDAWHFTPKWSITGSARADQHNRYGLNFSPRVSLLRQVAKGWTARVSATRGFFAPSPFVEESEAVGARRIRGFNGLEVETADYAAFDVNGRQGPVELNATAFASRINHQVMATPDTLAGTIVLSNAVAEATTSGAEFFAVYDLDPLFITALYTLTFAHEPASATSNVATQAPYLPRHAAGIDITWEDAEHGTWIALEAFYTGTQPLDRDPYRSIGRPFTVVGILFSQHVGRYKFFFNIENATNVKQTNFDPLLLPARRTTGEWTTNVWAPLEGRVFSFGIRLSSGDLVPH
jgi:outer membrane receptor for ferrienterochelin and colicins